MAEPSKTEIMLGRAFTEPERRTFSALKQAETKVESLLPSHLQGQAERLVSIAALTFCNNKNLQKKQYSLESFVQAVFQAAMCGLAIDGVMAYAVPYEGQLQFQADYKGLIAMAKRDPDVQDVYARHVYSNEQFEIGHDSGRDVLIHRMSVTGDRGDPIGVYAVIVFRSGAYRFDWMTMEEIHGIRNIAKTQKVWRAHPGEMEKKTVLRRLLKTYCHRDDIAHALAFDQEANLEKAPQEAPKLAEAAQAGVIDILAPGDPEPQEEPPRTHIGGVEAAEITILDSIAAAESPEEVDSLIALKDPITVGELQAAGRWDHIVASAQAKKRDFQTS